jgi:hypothetical protein
VVGVGLAFGVLWAAFFLALVTVLWIIRPSGYDRGDEWILVLLGAFSLVSGLTFGALLALAEAGKAILDLERGRAALWGLLGSAVFPLLAGKPDQVLVFSPIGAAAAAAWIAIARRAARHVPGHPRRVRDALATFVLAAARDAVGTPRRLP